MNKKVIVTVLSFLSLGVFSSVASAEDSVMEAYRASLKVATPTRFRQRIDNTKTQLDVAVSKGWLTAEQVEGFMQEYNQVDQMEKSVAASGFPDEECRKLEMAVTGLNHHVCSAMATHTNNNGQGFTDPEINSEESDKKNRSAKRSGKGKGAKTVRKSHKHRRHV